MGSLIHMETHKKPDGQQGRKKFGVPDRANHRVGILGVQNVRESRHMKKLQERQNRLPHGCPKNHRGESFLGVGVEISNGDQY